MFTACAGVLWPAHQEDIKEREVLKMALGTNWVAPQAGSSVGDILQAVHDAGWPISYVLVGESPEAKTNLVLTGCPLQNFDIQRIQSDALHTR